MQEGYGAMEGAIRGAKEMVVPVTFAILTRHGLCTHVVCAGGVWQFFRILPGVVVVVLVFSLIESFLVLPAHLGHKGCSGVGRQVPRCVEHSVDIAARLALFVNGSKPAPVSLQYFIFRWRLLMLFLVALGMQGRGYCRFTLPEIRGQHGYGLNTLAVWLAGRGG